MMEFLVRKSYVLVRWSKLLRYNYVILNISEHNLLLCYMCRVASQTASGAKLRAIFWAKPRTDCSTRFGTGYIDTFHVGKVKNTIVGDCPSQVKPQPPFLVVSMPSKYSLATVRSPASVRKTSNSFQGPKEEANGLHVETLDFPSNWEFFDLNTSI